MNRARVGLLLVPIFVSLVLIIGYADNKVADSKDAKVNEASKLESLKKLRNVIGIVKESYVDELSYDEIVNKAIDGLISNLDAHSTFLDAKSFKDLRASMDGEFGGIGITVGLKDGALSVIAPIDNTPGDKAGLKSGDVIIRVNGKSTIDMSIDEAVNLMRGAPKTKVELVIVRKGESQPLTFSIMRDIIKVDSVKAKKIQDTNYLYLRIASFDKNVTRHVLDELKKAGKIDGIVLDLRNNPGGALDQAVDLGRMFIQSGVIVSQKGRQKDENIEYKVTKKAPYPHVPIAVLINGGSASASEIVAGALQDHKRGVLVGEQTFGKGSVQLVMQLDQNEGLKLTTAKYYLPSGRTIQAVGITPDIIAYPGVVPESVKGFGLKESDFKRHLQVELDKVQNLKTEKEVDEDKDNITTAIIYQDNQLRTAIDVLKAWNVIGIPKSK